MIRGIRFTEVQGIKESIKAGWVGRAIDCPPPCCTKHGGNGAIGVSPLLDPGHVLELDGFALLDAGADELSLQADLGGEHNCIAINTG